MLDPELTPLLSHPSRRVEIPLVIVILDGASCCFDVGPLEFLANCTLYCRAHKCAATSRAAQLIDPSDELVIQLDVPSHAQNLAHRLNLRYPAECRRCDLQVLPDEGWDATEELVCEVRT